MQHAIEGPSVLPKGWPHPGWNAEGLIDRTQDWKDWGAAVEDELCPWVTVPWQWLTSGWGTREGHIHSVCSTATVFNNHPNKPGRIRGVFHLSRLDHRLYACLSGGTTANGGPVAPLEVAPIYSPADFPGRIRPLGHMGLPGLWFYYGSQVLLGNSLVVLGEPIELRASPMGVEDLRNYLRWCYAHTGWPCALSAPSYWHWLARVKQSLGSYVLIPCGQPTVDAIFLDMNHPSAHHLRKLSQSQVANVFNDVWAFPNRQPPTGEIITTLRRSKSAHTDEQQQTLF